MVLSFPTIERASLLLRLGASPNEYFSLSSTSWRDKPLSSIPWRDTLPSSSTPWRNTIGFLSTKDSSRPPEPSNTLAYVRIAEPLLKYKVYPHATSRGSPLSDVILQIELPDHQDDVQALLEELELAKAAKLTIQPPVTNVLQLCAGGRESESTLALADADSTRGMHSTNKRSHEECSDNESYDECVRGRKAHCKNIGRPEPW